MRTSKLAGICCKISSVYEKGNKVELYEYDMDCCKLPKCSLAAATKGTTKPGDDDDEGHNDHAGLRPVYFCTCVKELYNHGAYRRYATTTTRRIRATCHKVRRRASHAKTEDCGGGWINSSLEYSQLKCGLCKSCRCI